MRRPESALHQPPKASLRRFAGISSRCAHSFAARSIYHQYLFHFMTPLVLLVGFLGSGKTTYLRALLPALQSNGLDPHVVINDYQNAKVDAALLHDLAE